MTQAKEPNIIQCTVGGNPDVLLHMVRTALQLKAEIENQQKHIDHLKNKAKSTGVDIDISKEVSVLQSLIETREYVHGDFSEMKIWSRREVKLEDIVQLPNAYNKRFQITKIVSRSDHAGRFEKVKDSKNTFYVLQGVIN